MIYNIYIINIYIMIEIKSCYEYNYKGKKREKE